METEKYKEHKQIVRIARRMEYVKYSIRDIVVKAKELEAQGTEMFWLNIGDPNVYRFKPPAHIMEAMKSALDESIKTGKYSSYAPSRGDPDLINAVIDYEHLNEEQLYDGEKPENRVFIVNGLSEGIDFLFQALVNPGEHILLPKPAYPLYVTKQKVFGLQDGKDPDVVLYNYLSNGEPDLNDLRSKITDKTKAILVINPNNPTGVVYTRNILEKIIDIAEEKRIPIIGDDAYEMILLDDDAKSDYINLRQLVKGRDVVLISGGSISKNYVYPGLRVGWLAIHGKGNQTKQLTDELLKLANQRLSINWIAQIGALAAIKGPKDHISHFNEELRKRRDYVLKRIEQLKPYGVHLPFKPRGGFYAFIQVDNHKHIWKDDWDLVYALLNKGLVTVPGSGFGMKREGNKLYFRIVFLPSVEILEKAFSKIEEVVKKNK